jgi:hypothetical protein
MFLIGMIASLLPSKVRAELFPEQASSDLRKPAIASGLSQMVGCMAALMLGFKPFVQSQFAQIDHRAVTAGVESSGETAVMGIGLVIAVAYILRPLSIALFYFSFEGAVRAIAAFTGNELIGTLPLYLLLLVGRKAKKEVREFKLGPRIRDKVFPAPDGESEYDLVIASCRPKDWNQSLTIQYQDQLYELVRSIEGDPPRRFVFLLKKAPLSKLVRGLHDYDPDEGLVAESANEP